MARASPQKNEGITIFWETDLGAAEGAAHTSSPFDLARGTGLPSPHAMSGSVPV